MIKGYLLAIFTLLFLRDRVPNRKIIKRWSRLFHMKVKYHSRYTELFSVDIIEDTLYISHFNKAVHDRFEYLASLAHEFGHLIDYAYKDYYFEEDELYKKMTDHDAIYEDEVKAWQIAKILLQDEDVYNEKSFTDLESRCLEQYRAALTLTKPKRKKSAKKSKTTK